MLWCFEVQSLYLTSHMCVEDLVFARLPLSDHVSETLARIYPFIRPLLFLV